MIDSDVMLQGWSSEDTFASAHDRREDNCYEQLHYEPNMSLDSFIS